MKESSSGIPQRLSSREDGAILEPVERVVVYVGLVDCEEYSSRYGASASKNRMRIVSDIVQDAVENHRGNTIQSLDDKWMLLFFSIESAILAAVQMQRDIAHLEPSMNEPIRLRASLDIGQLGEDLADMKAESILVCGSLFESGARGEILISQQLHDKLGPYFQIRCSAVDEHVLSLPGSRPLVYRLDWREFCDADRGIPFERKLIIEVLWKGTESRITLADSRDTDPTVHPYEAHQLNLEEIDQAARQIFEAIQSANHDGGLRRALVDLEIAGRKLFECLFPPEIRKKIFECEQDSLILKLDDACVHIPWELAHDGRDYLCCRFSMGRIVRTSQTPRPRRRPQPTEKFNLLAVSDPRGNLSAAALEGRELYDLCRRDVRVDIEWLNNRVTYEQVESCLSRFDVVHYCGHAAHDQANPDKSGWDLADRIFDAGSFQKISDRADALPLLVFNNGCHGGETEAWDRERAGWSYGFGNALLLSGCGHYIGAASQLLDTGSKEFAREFYRSVISGYSMGRSLRRARLAYRASENAHDLTWAQYILYGDPEASLFAELAPSERASLTAPSRQTPLANAGHALKERPSQRQRWRLAMVAALALFIFLYAWQQSWNIWRQAPPESLSGVNQQTAASPPEPWTSRPISIGFNAPTDNDRTIFTGGGKDMKPFVKHLQKLLVERNIQIVPQEKIDQAVKTLRISLEEAGLPENARKIQSLVDSRILATVKYQELRPKARIALSLLDLEKGVVLAEPAAEVPKSTTLLAPELVKEVMELLEKKYPLQGLVSSIGEDGIRLNIGRAHGAQPGYIFEVYPSEEESGIADAELLPMHLKGKLIIQRVDENCAWGQTEGDVKLAAGMRARHSF